MLTAVLATLALAPATIAADCSSKTAPVSVRGGELLEAEFTGGGGPLGPRRLTLGDPIEGDQLKAGQAYYTPKGVTATTTIARYDFKVSEKSVFMPQCELFGGTGLYFRFLEGEVRVVGPEFSGSSSKGYAVTPEASFKPLPGQPNYTLTRKVTNKRKRTHSTVHVNKGGSSMFVTLSSVSGKKVPCKAGQDVTIYANGRTETG